MSPRRKSLVHYIDHETVDAVLEADKMPKVRRCNGVVHRQWIRVICEVDRIDPEAQFPILVTAEQRQLELAVHLQVEREEGRKTLGIGPAHVVLKIIDVRVRQS